MSWRLEAIAPDVAEQLRSMDDDWLRTVAARVARAALDEAPVEDARVAPALQALDAWRYGDGGPRNDLKALVDELDEAAWDLRDRVEEGDVDKLTYLAAFARARAAMALWFALEPDPLTAAMEAAYEAEAATDDILLRREVSAIQLSGE